MSDAAHTFELLRRPGPGPARRDARGAGRDHEHGRARAGRRHRRHHAVELPDAHGRLEGRAVAGRRQRDDPQAGHREPAHQPRAGAGSSRRPVCPRASSRWSPAPAARSATTSPARRDVDMVAFTGSVEVGKHIMRKGAENVKKVGLELGGKSPNIVFADADFEAAIDGALIGIFAGTGEVCSAGSRLLVERSIHDRFVGELVSRAMAIKVGDPLDERERDGPAGQRQQLDTVEKYVRIGQRRGRHAGHRRPPPRAAAASTTSPPSSSNVDNSHAHRPGGDLRAGAGRHPVRQRGRGDRASPTTRSTASPAPSGPRTSRGRCA